MFGLGKVMPKISPRLERVYLVRPSLNEREESESHSCESVKRSIYLIISSVGFCLFLDSLGLFFT